MHITTINHPSEAMPTHMERTSFDPVGFLSLSTFFVFFVTLYAETLSCLSVDLMVMV